MKIPRTKGKVDPHTQRKGARILINYHTHNSHFWRLKSNVFHGDIIRSNHILKHKCENSEDSNVLNDNCALIHSDNQWTEATRTTHRKKDREHPMDLMTLPVNKEIQPVPYLPPTNDELRPLKSWLSEKHINVETCDTKTMCQISRKTTVF